jgi:hypothetical protein
VVNAVNLQNLILPDQSIFVRASINGVIREGVIAACLTGLMILIFLGSWRSTIIIAISIPLSILASMIVLSALGETINIMTLGGLALAVGILVDDATVEVENINRNIDEGKEIIQAILDGASQIAMPALVSTLSICIVFVPMFFLAGVAKYLFVPLGRSGGVRDAGLLPAVADAGAHDGAVSSGRRKRRERHGESRRVRAIRSCGCRRNSSADSSACGRVSRGCWDRDRHRKRS